jgi:hypothetical protein
MPETSVSLDKDNIAIPSCFLLLTWVATRAVFFLFQGSGGVKERIKPPSLPPMQPAGRHQL